MAFTVNLFVASDGGLLLRRLLVLVWSGAPTVGDESGEGLGPYGRPCFCLFYQGPSCNISSFYVIKPVLYDEKSNFLLARYEDMEHTLPRLLTFYVQRLDPSDCTAHQLAVSAWP